MAVGKSMNIRAILKVVEKFQCNSTLSNIKHNYVALFLSQLYQLFVYDSKYFLIDHHCKRYVKKMEETCTPQQGLR